MKVNQIRQGIREIIKPITKQSQKPIAKELNVRISEDAAKVLVHLRTSGKVPVAASVNDVAQGILTDISKKCDTPLEKLKLVILSTVHNRALDSKYTQVKVLVGETNYGPRTNNIIFADSRETKTVEDFNKKLTEVKESLINQFNAVKNDIALTKKAQDLNSYFDVFR